MQITTAPPKYLPMAVIADGQVINRNLKELDLDTQWLEGKIKGLAISSIKDVFYAEIQHDGSIHIELKKE